MPRKSDSVPNVTMSGGKPRRVIMSTLSPPPASPTSSVSAIATGMGAPPSRQSAPNTTAASPIIEPTDRSIPPVTMIGVSASASSPTSTARRVTSNAFPAVRKWRPVRPNATHSAAMTPSSSHSPLGKRRSRNDGATSADCSAMDSADMMLQPPESDIGAEASEDDRALDRPRPQRADAHEGEGSTDGAEERDADDGADRPSASPGDRRAPHDHRGDRLELQPDPGVARDGGETHRVEHRRESHQRPCQRKSPEHDPRWLDPRQSRRFAIGAHRVECTPGSDVAQQPGEGRGSA